MIQKPLYSQGRREGVRLEFGAKGDLSNPFFRARACTVGGAGLCAPVGYIFNGKDGAINGAKYGALIGFCVWLMSESINSCDNNGSKILS